MRSDSVVHVVGAGLAGLAAAVCASSRGHTVAVYEAAAQAGGRCRSYFDAGFGSVIDNGNHLLLSGNTAALRFLHRIGGEHLMSLPPAPDFPFADLKSGERWTLRLSAGRFPVWLFDRFRRVPGTRPADYLSAAKLLWANGTQTITGVIGDESVLFRRLWHPLMVAALNTDPAEGSAKLAGAVMRNTLAKGGNACRPMIAKDGLSAAFIDPALSYVEARCGTISFGSRLRAVELDDGRPDKLTFGGAHDVRVKENDSVIIAVPAGVAASLLPGINTPTEFRAILNAHFRIAPPEGFPPLIGVVNSTVEWIFSFPDRISITVSAADRLMDRGREELADEIWREVSAITGLPKRLPPWQIVKEKRATFAATPQQDSMRPDAKTKWRSLYLAGDWTQTGLPATIEGAIRSGERAAKLAMKGH